MILLKWNYGFLGIISKEFLLLMVTSFCHIWISQQSKVLKPPPKSIYNLNVSWKATQHVLSKIAKFGSGFPSLTLQLSYRNPEKLNANLKRLGSLPQYHFFWFTETFWYQSFCEPKFPNHEKKIYDHTVNELGCPRSRLTALNAGRF